MTSEEIIDEMKQEIPYRVPVELEPFIKIAMKMYAREAIKADRERVVENAKATISTVPGWDQKIKAHNIPQETLISRFCVDPDSILNLPIELPKTK